MPFPFLRTVVSPAAFLQNLFAVHGNTSFDLFPFLKKQGMRMVIAKLAPLRPMYFVRSSERSFSLRLLAKISSRSTGIPPSHFAKFSLHSQHTIAKFSCQVFSPSFLGKFLYHSPTPPPQRQTRRRLPAPAGAGIKSNKCFPRTCAGENILLSPQV